MQIWFFYMSYKYIDPKGIKGHKEFLKGLPAAYKNFFTVE